MPANRTPLKFLVADSGQLQVEEHYLHYILHRITTIFAFPIRFYKIQLSTKQTEQNVIYIMYHVELQRFLMAGMLKKIIYIIYIELL